MVDVTLNQVISKADIEAGKLTFQGAANAEGSGYATAQFVVQNANGEDSTVNTLTFDVTAVEDEATGSVTFTTDATANAVQEGATVTANASGLTDVDGSISSTTFQWFVADDSSKTNAADISGATNAAYAIPADGTLNGKHLFVKVTTTDSKGNGLC